MLKITENIHKTTTSDTACEYLIIEQLPESYTLNKQLY